MDTCKWVDCTEPIEQSGRGRPRLYCPKHAAASTAARKKEWKPSVSEYYECCLHWQATGPRRRVCPQHRQVRQFSYRRPVQRPAEMSWLLESFGSRIFRVSSNPDSYEPRERREIKEQL